MKVTPSKPNENNEVTFKVRPRLLTLLGDQLIRDAGLAVFELVKNAYDADANRCTVSLEYVNEPANAKIVIQDTGCGMDEDILRNIWMVIATDFRAEQRKRNERTPKYKRFPLGEKGLGRLSVHKLGRFIRLVTRPEGGDEFVMEFDWDALEEASDLDSAPIKIVKRKPKTFVGNSHGTRIVVKKLRETWTRGEVRRLHRAVNSLCSPFKGPDDFHVELSTPGTEEWLEKLFTAKEAKRCAIYHVYGQFEGENGFFEYEFLPPQGTERLMKGRRESIGPFTLQRKDGRKSLHLTLEPHKIGPVEFEFWLFDRDPAVLRMMVDDVQGFKTYLDENGGIRVYRDGIRVYDFGEPGNDWLNLDIRRVNTPTIRTSNNQIIGVVCLDAPKSLDLKEKTNREGFIESRAYEAFRDAVISVLTQVEAEKAKDQKRLREVTGKGTGKNVFSKFAELREKLAQKGVLADIEPRLKDVEREIEAYRDQLLHAAVPGLTIGIMLHGAEKILEELWLAAKKGEAAARIKELVERLYRAMRPVTNILKNPSVAKTTGIVLIKEALFSVELRLKRHNIRVIEDQNSIKKYDFKLQGSKQMLVAAINNLIDNSIHWLETKDPAEKVIYIGITRELDGGPTIVVADNGPGFGNDQPEDLITPFFSRRVGGMGLGLYIVDEVMRVNQGRLVFPDSGDLELPEECDGAIVGLQFAEEK